MKMENEIKAPIDGTVKEIYVSEGQALENGFLMMEVEKGLGLFNQGGFMSDPNDFQEEMKRFKKQFEGVNKQLPGFGKFSGVFVILILVLIGAFSSFLYC